MPNKLTPAPARRPRATMARPKPVLLAGRRLHTPRRSRSVPQTAWRPVSLPLAPVWQERARAKGFRIHSRIRDTSHVALECLSCGALTAHKLYTLQTARPACGGCQDAERVTKARAAGLVFLHRDETNRHYGFYRASCGHVIRRQFELIDRVIAGQTEVRCDTCLIAREAAVALKHGWRRVGPDEAGDPNYRLYRHRCGHLQRSARVNMSSNQVDCAGCGVTWTAKPSSIYLVRITDPAHSMEVVKLGYSARVGKRFRYQLGLPDTARTEVLRVVQMPTGHAACAAEKKAHALLRRRFPASVVPVAEYAGFINVVSEIYRPALLPDIDKLLDRIEAGTRLTKRG